MRRKIRKDTRLRGNLSVCVKDKRSRPSPDTTSPRGRRAAHAWRQPEALRAGHFCCLEPLRRNRSPRSSLQKGQTGQMEQILWLAAKFYVCAAPCWLRLVLIIFASTGPYIYRIRAGPLLLASRVVRRVEKCQMLRAELQLARFRLKNAASPGPRSRRRRRKPFCNG